MSEQVTPPAASQAPIGQLPDVTTADYRMRAAATAKGLAARRPHRPAGPPVSESAGPSPVRENAPLTLAELAERRRAEQAGTAPPAEGEMTLEEWDARAATRRLPSAGAPRGAVTPFRPTTGGSLAAAALRLLQRS
jgi:hypothetical protein